ncbi:hypothetical protein D3C75_1318370 [compost metagenome]
MLAMIALRDRPCSLGRVLPSHMLAGKNTLVAITVSSRRVNSFSSLPRMISEVPAE